MIAQFIDPEWSAEQLCAMARKWKIDLNLAFALHRMAKNNQQFGISIISGFRTCEEQQRLEAQGRPAAPCDVSTHTSCPATGADLQPSVAVNDYVKAQLGVSAALAGLRWGGGSPVSREGIPVDWNHVDLGPRVS